MSKKRKPPTTCRTPSCSNQLIPGSKYCALCDITVRFHKQVDKANRRGDTLGALVNTGLAFLFNGIREGKVAAPTLQNPFGRIPRQPQQSQQRPPNAGQPNPFQVLGLDARTATEKEVQRIQRGAAQMWHEDKGGGAQAQSRLAEINAAAQACIQSIRARKAS